MLTSVGVLVASMIAANVDLQAAEALMAKYKYAEARTALAKARAGKRLDRKSLMRILELQGIAAGQLRLAAPATAAFQELLVLSPNFKLASDYAPRVMTPFLEAAQVVAESGSLEFSPGKVETTARAVKGIRVAVTKDPMSHAREVIFHVNDGTGWRAVRAPLNRGEARLAVDAGEIRWWAELIGENEAQLAVIGSQGAPQVSQPPPAVSVVRPPPPPPPPPKLSGGSRTDLVAPPPPSSSGVRTASYFVMGAGAIALGVGTYFGLSSAEKFRAVEGALKTENVITGISERKAAELNQQGASEGLIANAFFIGGGSLVLGGAVMWLVGAPVVATPTPNGVMVSGRFP